MSEDGEEVHVPSETVKLQVFPAAILASVVVLPEPLVMIPSGLVVIVQLPEGKSLNETPPVDTEHVG